MALNDCTRIRIHTTSSASAAKPEIAMAPMTAHCRDVNPVAPPVVAAAGRAAGGWRSSRKATATATSPMARFTIAAVSTVRATPSIGRATKPVTIVPTSAPSVLTA